MVNDTPVPLKGCIWKPLWGRQLNCQGQKEIVVVFVPSKNVHIVCIYDPAHVHSVNLLKLTSSVAKKRVLSVSAGVKKQTWTRSRQPAIRFANRANLEDDLQIPTDASGEMCLGRNSYGEPIGHTVDLRCSRALCIASDLYDLGFWVAVKRCFFFRRQIK